MDTSSCVKIALILISVLLPSNGFDIFNKIRPLCPLDRLKDELDQCTGIDQPYYIFLPPSLYMDTSVGIEDSVSSTGVQYSELFNHVDDNKCQREERRKIERQMQCRYDVLMKCVPYRYKDFLPDRIRIREGMEYLCENRMALHQSCEDGKLAQQNSCVKDRDRNSYTEDEEFTEEDRMCRTYDFARTCLESSLNQCDQRVVDLYLRVMDYYRPRICGAASHVISLAAILFISGFAHALFIVFQ